MGTKGWSKVMAGIDTDALLALAQRRAEQPCGVETTLSVIEGRWKPRILFQLLDGTKRFSELKRELPGVTQRMLTLHVRELERDGLVHREVYREVPPKVEYSLTAMGRSLEPLLRFMSNWGHDNRARLVSAVAHAAGAGMADLAARLKHTRSTSRSAAPSGPRPSV